jgi:vacuolar-type H+-ATPase subunit H
MSDKEYIKQIEEANRKLIERSEKSERALEDYMNEMSFLKHKMVNSVQNAINKANKSIRQQRLKIVPLKGAPESKNLTVSTAMFDSLMETIDTSLIDLDKALDEVVKDKV